MKLENNSANLPVNIQEEIFNDNSYEILYADDISKLKKEKEIKEQKRNKRNKKINKFLNFIIFIIIIAIIISVIKLAFPDKIQEIKDHIDAYITNMEIEKEAQAGNLTPAYLLGDEEEQNSSLENILDKESIINEPNTEIDENKAASFMINNEKIHNFNEEVLINVPEEAYVQSTNENKILMLNSSKVYKMYLNCNSYEVQEGNNKYNLIIHCTITNANYPDGTNLDGIVTANIENEIITSNRNNIKISEGQTSNIDISFDLTETQFKLIKNEIDNITFIYRDKYNYREIFATYGGNYTH